MKNTSLLYVPHKSENLETLILAIRNVKNIIGIELLEDDEFTHEDYKKVMKLFNEVDKIYLSSLEKMKGLNNE